MRNRMPSTLSALPRRGGIVGSVAAAGVLVAAVAAYGWISVVPSTGAGTVKVGEPLKNIGVSGPTNFPLLLDEPVTLDGSFVNENSFRVSVARVKIEVTGISGPPDNACSIAPNVNFFTTDAVPVTGRFSVSGETAVGGTGSGDWSGGTIEFRSSPTLDQNACVGRRINLKYTAVA